MKIGKNQLKIIQNSKKFLHNYNSHKKNNLYSALYLCPFDFTLGHFYLRKISELNKNNLDSKNLKYLIKFFFSFFFTGNFKVFNESIKLKKNVIISPAHIEDFDKNGNFNDRYFNVSSKNNDQISWILVFNDKKLPKKINKNLILIQREINFLLSLKKLFLTLTEIFFQKKKFFFVLNQFCYLTNFANFLSSFLKKLNFDKTKNILFIFEGQPYNYSIVELFKNKKNIKTKGYLHAYPQALTTNFINRGISPSKLIVSSNLQKKHLVTHLNWKKKNIKILPSLRFQKKNKKNFKRVVFLPTEFNSIKFIVDQMKFIINEKKVNLSNFKIKIHPKNLKNKKHLNLKKNIETELKKNNTKINNKDNFSIFIGATGSIIEALQHGIKCYHICEEPIFEAYSYELWKDIRVKELTKNIYLYLPNKKRRYMIFDKNKKKILKKYINL
tara:strand:- start:217 stop:1542 length:1326 start_codon:yes stop_codon:yes gene_type:complete